MAAPLRVLIIEDSPDDVTLLIRELRRGGYDVTWQVVSRREEMQAALARQPWDLVFSDHAMPAFSAPGALRLLREGGHDIPLVIVSGITAEAAQAMLKELGAHDYVVKSDLSRLVPVVRRQLQETEERRARRWAGRKRQRETDE
ncbi:MAG: response regulator [Nitrospirota bacterium]